MITIRIFHNNTTEKNIRLFDPEFTYGEKKYQAFLKELVKETILTSDFTVRYPAGKPFPDILFEKKKDRCGLPLSGRLFGAMVFDTKNSEVFQLRTLIGYLLIYDGFQLSFNLQPKQVVSFSFFTHKDKPKSPVKIIDLDCTEPEENNTITFNYDLLIDMIKTKREGLPEEERNIRTVSKKIGINKMTWQRIQTKQFMPNLDTFVKLCQWLEVKDINIFFKP